YGLFMLGGFIAAYIAVIGRARIIGIPERRILDLLLIAVVGGMIGSRARYVWERPELFTHKGGQPVPWRDVVANAMDFDQGGMVWYGGAILVTLVIVAYAWWNRVRILPLGDIVLPGLLLGLAVGRIGCHFNGCCFGHPTSLPWGVSCWKYPGEHVHPTQLYETIACVLMFAALWWFWRRRRSDGQVCFAVGVGYGAWRFINEGLRGDDKIPSNLLGLPSAEGMISTSQATSLHIIVVTIVVAALVIAHRRRRPEADAVAHLVPGSRHARKPAENPGIATTEPIQQG
ncbi:MAG: prolipoprotein diacylglyceryl transferase, partial [Planctomycetes bacterium]|nr:prolipoprotein diacylglyceryl transferase [Planctomycetota bacterium]